MTKKTPIGAANPAPVEKPAAAPGRPATPALAPNPDQAALAREWGQLDAGVPLALLPVRLETRFIDGALLIRIEPDVLHHDMHVSVLRADETALARQFWASVAATGTHAAACAVAWKTLASALGPWRAAWVARAVKLGVAEGSERGRPALARLLPARWVAKAWFDGKPELLGWSRKVRAPLHLGFDIDDPHWLDAKALDADEQAGRLRLDPQARWMTDFDEAEACGMAIRVPLASHPALQAHLQGGKAIEELLVVGVDHELNAASAGERFAKLLDAHRYSRGLELVCQGTPTNNTEQVRTGVTPSKPDLDGLLQRELRPWLPGGAPAEAMAPQTQSGRLARALGLDRAGLVQRLEHAAVRQDEASATMNRLLWPLSFGELFDKLLVGLEDPTRSRLVDRTALGPLKEWFCAHVRGGGNLTTLRVGAQPYGVLPVRRLKRRGAPPTQGALGHHVNDAIDLLRDSWREVLPRVTTIKPVGKGDDAQAALLKILSAQPHPWEFTVQRATDCREVLGDEYAGYNWAASQHAPLLGALMPNLRSGEPGRSGLEFVNVLFGGPSLPLENTADDFLGMLVCWAKLLCSNTGSDALPGILASPAASIAKMQKSLEADWIANWKQDATQWQAALAGKPLPPIPKSVHDLIAYIDWLLGNPNWLVEILKPEGVWAAYHTGLYKRKLALEGQGVKPGSGTAGAELDFCQRMLARIGEETDEGVPTLLRQARDALVLHRDRIAPLELLFARWGRSDRLVSHIRKDGPTGAFLAFEDQDIGVVPPNAVLVQAPDASAGDQAHSYLTELGNAAAAASSARWDAARLTQFADAALNAAKPAALSSFRTEGMSSKRMPPLLFQLARSALATTPTSEQDALRKQLRALAAFDPAELELRLRETLGLATHRLDAWASGLASEALDGQRDKRPTGLQIGAYGWVENLRRDEAMRESQGHLLAPSMAHAATAAVLRAGWLAYGTGPAPQPGLAVDLSSSRVRRGRWMLDGLRSGQPLGDLLGYRFERALHERQLDAWIDKVRLRVSAATGVGDERQPVDGLSLWNLWNAADTKLTAMVDGEPRLRAEFAGLGTLLDALLDLTSAESVYQLVQGNMTRMAASLDALGLPDVDPPPCNFPVTPRPGRTITHRLLLALPDGAAVAADDGWADSPRSLAAPAVERWARLALGPATRYRIVTRWIDGAGQPLALNAPVDARQLGLSALDVVYLCDDAADGGAAWRAHLMGLVALPAGGPGPWRLELQPDARDGLAGTDFSAAALIGLAGRLRRLLSDLTPADARHFGRPGDNPAPGTDADVGELSARAFAVAQRLHDASLQLAALIPALADLAAAVDAHAALDASIDHALEAGIEAPALRSALLDAARFGDATYPLCGLSRPGDADHVLDHRQLLRMAVAVSRGLTARADKVAKAIPDLDKGSPAQRAAVARHVFELALGRELPVPATFRLAGADGTAAEVEASLAVSGQRPGEGPGARMHWLTQAACVQPRVARLGEALLHRAGTGAGAALEIHAVQLPHRLVAGMPEPWAATAAPLGDRKPRVCVLVCGARPRPLTVGAEPGPLQALLVAQWSEVIPDGRQTAAVAFHYDAPASRPPQAILLAMVPEGQAAWTCDDVVDTVRETLEWARLRAVGPAELAQARLNLGQYLPALFSPLPFELPDTLLPGKAGLTHRWRLEGKTSTENLEPGTQARIADPLWMLSRQWQVGEFQGEDAATPVIAQVELETTPLTSLRCEPGGNLGARPQALPVPEIAEVLAEAQDPRASAGGYARRAKAGLEFLSMLRDAGLGALGEPVRAAFRLEPISTGAELVAADRRRVDELSALAPDGVALAAALRADPGLAGSIAATAAERTQLASLAGAWLAQFDAAPAPGAGGNGWASARMEYGLSLAAAGAEGEWVLRASEYPGGRLDWDAFDLTGLGSHGLAAAPSRVRMHVRIPSPLRYAGMPAERWWEFEDGEVNFGGLQATPADLQRMMIAGFATSCSDEWFYLPITLPSGRLARVKSLHVLDSLGHRHSVASMAALDHVADATRPWRLFELSGDPGPAAGRAPWLLLAPALPDAIEGPPLEKVQFLRDETSNLVWALERQVEGPLGEAVDRVLAWKTLRGTGAAALALADGHWRYEVAPPTPGYLVPFLPERNAEAQVRLRRGRMHQGLDGTGRPVTSGAVGAILNPAAPGAPLRIFEEEIPAGGVEVQRAWQLARDRNGRVWLWLGQRKRPGKPTKEPGVVFDRISRR